MESMATGAIAPALAAIVTNPADVAKTRLNMARELQSGSVGSVLDCWRSIFAAEGLVGLQRGLGFVLIRESTKNAFRLGLFEPLVNVIDRDGGAKPAMSSRVAAGAISGGLSAFLCNPLDLLKTRIQLDPVKYNQGFIGGFKQVISGEGAGALLTGLGPTAQGYFIQVRLSSQPAPPVQRRVRRTADVIRPRRR